MSNFSKTQIDRLGNRLRIGHHTESDLRLLDDYRLSFGEAHEAVIKAIRLRNQSPTGRAKSRISIVEKLHRESVRLSQVQDIAGCRIVVTDIVEQEQFVSTLITDFPQATVIDRRDRPSYGYRAVHIIVTISGKPVEIQVRTKLQHLWAELSEKSSDVLDPTIKYGGGSGIWQNLLAITSKAVASIETAEKIISEMVVNNLPNHAEQVIRGEMAQRRNEIADTLSDAITLLDKQNLSNAISLLDKQQTQKQ